MRGEVRPRRASARPVDPVGEMLRLHRRLDELQSEADERNGRCLDELQALGLRGEGRHRPTKPEAKADSSHEKGNALRGRRLTGAKWARKGEVLRCGKCGHSDLSTELFACRYRDEGAVTRRHGRLPSCGSVICPRCLSSGVPEKAHPSRKGRAPVELRPSHARLNAGAHVCTHCRWGVCTGKMLDMSNEEDVYVWELITQYQLDIYRHLTPKTTTSYAREVNLLSDFASALPDLEKSDVMGGVVYDVERLRGSTIHGMLWLHLERRHGIKYASIRKVRSVHTKLLELYGEESELNVMGSEFKRFSKAFRMRVGTGSKPSPALSAVVWIEMIRLHMGAFDEALAKGETRQARDSLCRAVHAELSFLGFLRPGEQVCMQREDVKDMLCDPSRACGLGVLPFVCLPLLGGTKNNTTAPCGVVVCWETASTLRVGDHVQCLLTMYEAAGRREGPLLTHGAGGTGWTRSFALHRVLRPALRKLQEIGSLPATVDVKEYTSNTFRRGGNTHALDRGVTRPQCTAHGRWESQWESREGLAMVDLYDATGTDRKLDVTTKMG